MDPEARRARLTADHQLLTALQAASTIFTFEASGDPPDRYRLTFRGKGLRRDPSAQSEVTPIELHQIDLRMPYSYPESPPDIRWLTPILHPNVSFSGLVSLSDVGLAWTKDVPIDVVCQRLWDMARGECLNLETATNHAAKNWLESECRFELPVDHRSLRDRVEGSGSNIVRYERRGQGVKLAAAPGQSEIMFIDENTPTPPMPPRQPYVPVRRRRPSDEEMLYIGPE